MRGPLWICSCFVAAACSSEPKDDGFFLVAVRPIDGPWTASTCIDEWPTDKPYELVIISGLNGSTSISALRTGPGDRPIIPAPCDGPPPEFSDVEVQLIGAPTARVTLRGSAGGTVQAPTSTLEHVQLGIQDVLAVPFDYTGGLGKYVLERGANVSSRGIVVDVASAAKPLEHRDVIMTGFPNHTGAAVTLWTAGGTYGEIWPEFPRQEYDPTTISMVPTSDLIDGDEETLAVENVWVNLATIPPGPITVNAPPPIADASCVFRGSELALDASTSAAWNEYLIDVNDPSSEGRRLSLEKKTGWPEAGFQVPDFASIPGWQPEWMVEATEYLGAFTSCRFMLCEHTTMQRSCSGYVVRASNE